MLRLVRRLRDGRREFALALFYARRLCEVRPSPRGERGFWAGGVGWDCDVVAPGAALAVMPCRLAGGRVALWVGDAAAGVTARLGGGLGFSWSVPVLGVANRKGPG